ncbi:hypothetical protein [Ponticaulis sp.]|uniref:hypothetical protein n=1 Tax=Ponticaulis sp. TaxID=2020902 RepID=UPI0025D55CDC|nr:hypothetical protein [Ponticaulis sp.]
MSFLECLKTHQPFMLSGTQGYAPFWAFYHAAVQNAVQEIVHALQMDPTIIPARELREGFEETHDFRF